MAPLPPCSGGLPKPAASRGLAAFTMGSLRGLCYPSKPLSFRFEHALLAFYLKGSSWLGTSCRGLCLPQPPGHEVPGCFGVSCIIWGQARTQCLPVPWGGGEQRGTNPARTPAAAGDREQVVPGMCPQVPVALLGRRVCPCQLTPPHRGKMHLMALSKRKKYKILPLHELGKARGRAGSPATRRSLPS